MKKGIKAILVGFIALNVIGGTFIGIREYSKERQARVAFENFYNPPEVKGATIKKEGTDTFFMNVIYFMGTLTTLGVTYSFVRRKRLELSGRKHQPFGRMK